MKFLNKKEPSYHFVAEILGAQGTVTNIIDGVTEGRIESYQDYKEVKDKLREQFKLGSSPIIIRTLHKL
ncbi:hypothetical protein SCRM01_275 [Synechococcus phage S-CRM01]|uniref:hypothetical protein n=1 Tax=Synechococcus phage S-CRM01 TaxID=1026955 RepID=UPI000209E30F|nr:hypothetical protein SCRM01_275 [Synechococcus phage S-CRM01]AEC53221.1 hypothetical protein SCRM01_275 [Synechococcus phage S-CRM01]